MLYFFRLSCLAVVPFSLLAAEEVAKISLKTLTAQMRYTEDEFVVRPGQKVELTFENGDDLPHNIVFCQPGTDVVAMTMKQMENAPEAMKRNWLPDDKAIWAHSKMLNPHESELVRFNAPTKTGAYPFVCTFPGHALTMKGTLRVLPMGAGLTDLNFSLYLGDWKELPDFTQLKAHRSGPVPNNQIHVKLDDYKNEFGVVFTGKLEAPRDGRYQFFLASDDGGQILVDGKAIVTTDGIHPAGSGSSDTIELTKGSHAFELRYFQAAGQIELAAAWKGPGFDFTPLSTWIPDSWTKGAPSKRKKNEWSPLPIIVESEPIIYRNFIAGAGTRGIGVGFPGQKSMVWSSLGMSPILLWRGAFMDAGRHWTNRGGGHQIPAGFDVVRLIRSSSAGIAQLSSDSDPWPELTEEKRSAEFAWEGYKLDAQRVPTFHYRWQSSSIEDRLVPDEKGFTRILKVTGAPPANTQLLIAEGTKIQQVADNFEINEGKQTLDGQGETMNHFLVHCEGARQRGAQVIVPLIEGTLTVRYSWSQ